MSVTLPSEPRPGGIAPPAVRPARVPAAMPRRLLGLLLVIFASTPLFRLLDPGSTGLAGEATAWFMEIYLEFVWFGLLLMLPVGLIGARATPRLTAHLRTLGRRLRRLPIRRVAIGLGLTAGLLASLFSLLVLEGKPNNIDSYAQLLHARYWASGALAGPFTDTGFWMIQNSLFTDRGWVSQYPPGHVFVLSLALLLGLPWLAGPVLTGVAVTFATLTADRLLPGRRTAAILGGAALAVSPFFIVIGASFMNHVTAAAFVCIGAYGTVRAWEGSSRWALAAGAAFGFAFLTRPLSTLAMGAALTLLVPFAVASGPGLVRFARIAATMAAGALPFLLLLFLYNTYFFGHPLVSGYEVALGPQMRLGFLVDPWGNAYGVREAIAYTSADLMALGVNMFESPVSAVLVIGAFLLLAPRLRPGERVLVGWALAPVATNFFYWHHGNFMGPRMLHEAAPAWTLLFAVAAVGLVTRMPRQPVLKLYRPRAGLALLLVGATAFGLVAMTPQRALSYGGRWNEIGRTPVPALDEPAVVFVHDAWPVRIAMTLAAANFRLDFVETLVRQNSACAVHSLADAVAGGDEVRQREILARLDTLPRAGSELLAVRITRGAHIGLRPGEQLTPECEAQARSDRHGILDIAPLLWRGDLHGRPGSGTLFVRDLGPQRNAEMLAAHPQRRPWVYMMPDTAAALPVLVPYEAGMRALWSELSTSASAPPYSAAQ
jgi:hypothetical protein